MNKDLITPWLVVGYELFAQGGVHALKIELLAQKVGKSKSSFYHYFGDIEVFLEHLLDYNFDKRSHFATKVIDCQNAEDLAKVLLNSKDEMFFMRQMRIAVEHENIALHLAKIRELVAPALNPIYAKLLGMPDKMRLSRRIMFITADHFFLQMTDKKFTYTWILESIHTIVNTVKEIKSV